MTTLVLASASPARLGVLRTAGLDPVVLVSGVDEDEILVTTAHLRPAEQVTALAEAKADAVVRLLAGAAAGNIPLAATDPVGRLDPADLVVIGCDSMLLIDGELHGKPRDGEQAASRWRRMAGRDGDLITGHAVRRVEHGAVVAQASAARSTVVRMGTPTELELAAYIGTGEPLTVAGALTIDGFGGWFVEGVDGDPSNVLGISLSLTRDLLARVGVSVIDLWSVPDHDAGTPAMFGGML